MLSLLLASDGIGVYGSTCCRVVVLAVVGMIANNMCGGITVMILGR